MGKRYEAEKIGEIHRLKKKKIKWDEVIGCILFVLIVLMIIGANT